MNKKIIIILVLAILIIVGTFFVFVNNKNEKTNKTNQERTSYNQINLSDDASALNAETQNTVSNQEKESEISIMKNEQNDNKISSNKNDKKENLKVENIKIKVNNNVLNVKLENNSSVNSLIEKLKQGDITINAHEYGNFEKVGSLGFSLPTNDTQIRTTVGDVMLYQGNQITLFYGSNSWSYTRLGKIIGVSESELKSILGSGDTTLVLSIE